DVDPIPGYPADPVSPVKRWVRVGFKVNPGYNPAPQFVPPRVLPPVAEVQACVSPLHAGAPDYVPASAGGPSAVLATTGGTFAAQQHHQLQQSKDARAGVEQVASRFASAVLTYDYRNLDKTKQGVLALSTGKFHTDYEQNFGGLSALFTTTKGQSTATVKDVF